MDVQARIPAALCAIHNFIQCLDPDTFFTPEFQARRLEDTQDDDDAGDLGVCAEGPVTTAERRRAEEQWDMIAERMWQDYCWESREREHERM